MKNLTLPVFVLFAFALLAPVAGASAYSCSPPSGPVLHRDTLPDCTRLDSLELLDTTSPVLDADMDYEHLYGINNDRLSESATVNGKQDLAAALDPVFLQALGADTYRSDTYQILEITFLLTAKGEIRQLWLTNELFWYAKTYDGQSQYELLDKNNTEELAMARTFGLMTREEIEQIKQLIRTQEWEPGRCDGQPVNTIVSLTLNDLP